MKNKLTALVQSYLGMTPQDKDCFHWSQMQDKMVNEIEELITTQNSENNLPIRDQLAMAALIGLVSNTKYFNPDMKHKMITEPLIFKRAYSMADGMLEARKKPIK